MGIAESAIIIGAGPAGLTAAYELLTRTAIKPIIIEADCQVGGISKTVNYKGNRIDIGGHRFFSKSDRVMEWWQKHMPLEAGINPDAILTYQQKSRPLNAMASPQNQPDSDAIMLLRDRKSRIYHGGSFFDYPLKMSPETLQKLGLKKAVGIGLSYGASRMHPISPEVNLEDFLINRFGRRLYHTFFKDYTEKVWGVPCQQISAEWGAQRIKGLSLRVALKDILDKSLTRFRPQGAEIAGETSLIEQFLYPKYGPGQMWEIVADKIRALGGEIILGQKVNALWLDEKQGKIRQIDALDRDGQIHHYEGAHFFSTMPIRSLFRDLKSKGGVPEKLLHISAGLLYRDFITVGVLSKNLNRHKALSDNWIYIQEQHIKMGRLQIFNNWSPFMVADPTTTWIGLEYFCNVGDALWSRSDGSLKTLGIDELHQMKLVHKKDILDATVLRVKKTYPAYFGTYDEFPHLRHYLDAISNLYPIGRNGMHRYNNQDHSMLTALIAVDTLSKGAVDKERLWSVNTEPSYHEEK